MMGLIRNISQYQYFVKIGLIINNILIIVCRINSFITFIINKHTIMAQGIVRVTPRPGSPGQLSITVADPNNNEVKVGDLVSFSDPGFAMKVGQVVNCNILNKTSCVITTALAS
jgi:hypothetical protein